MSQPAENPDQDKSAARNPATDATPAPVDADTRPPHWTRDQNITIDQLREQDRRAASDERMRKLRRRKCR